MLSDSKTTDKYAVQLNQAKLSSLVLSKDEGSHRLQAAVDASTAVILRSSSPGRDAINSDIAELKRSWDEFDQRLNAAKIAQDKLMKELTERDNVAGQLKNWLQQAELDLNQELKSSVSTLADKKARLERVKVC